MLHFLWSHNPSAQAPGHGEGAVLLEVDGVDLLAVALLVQHLGQLLQVPQPPGVVPDGGGQEPAARVVAAPRHPHIALWANHLKGWCIFWNWPLSGLQGVEVCAGLLQSVPMGAAECVQGYRVCAGCSFNILPCSSRLNQKIFY